MQVNTKTTSLDKVDFTNHLLFRAEIAQDASNMLDEFLNQIIKSDKANVINVNHEDNSIGIDELRAIRPITSKKNENIWQVIVIKDAQKLTVEAQNYLLKELEDSNKGNIYLLSSNLSNSILSTVISRTHVINYSLPKTTNIANEKLLRATGYSQTKYEEIISDSNSNFESIKNWLTSSNNQRLTLINSYSSDVSRAVYFINILKIIYFGLYLTYIENNNLKKITQTIAKIDILNETEKRVTARGNLKLNLTNLTMHL